MSPETGAVCATHPLQPSTFTCDRCGSFGCRQCAEATQQRLCPACHARLVAPPLSVERVVPKAFSVAFGSLERVWPLLGVQIVPNVALSFVTQTWNRDLQLRLRAHTSHGDPFQQLLGDTTPQQLALFAGAALLAGLLQVVAASTLQFAMQDELDGRRRPLGEWVQAGLARTPALLLAVLLSIPLYTLATLCCVVPALAATVFFGLMPALVVVYGLGPVEGFLKSYELVKPRFWSMALIELVLLVLPMVVGGVAGATSTVGQLLGTAGILGSAVLVGSVGVLFQVPIVTARLVILGQLRLDPAQASLRPSEGPG
jgi:hypothetical protein